MLDPDVPYRITVPVTIKFLRELENQGGGVPWLGAKREIFLSGVGDTGLMHSIGEWEVESVEYTFVGHPSSNGPSVYLVTLKRPVLDEP